MFGVDVGRGVRVGFIVAVGTRVWVAVGCGVFVSVGAGATVEHADTTRAKDKNNKTNLKLNLCSIYPPCWDVV
jgi:hypothetical protein